MSDVRELYQDLILDHYKRPRNLGRLESPDGEADGFNPLCGDQVHVTVKLADGRVADVRFEGKGCAISTASASLMTECIKGKTKAEAEAFIARFHGMLVEPNGSEPDFEAFGKAAVLAGVKEFPVRVKCATLAWHTLRAALEGEEGAVSTE
jgi:nitrogen fixation NifU-like protein